MLTVVPYMFDVHVVILLGSDYLDVQTCSPYHCFKESVDAIKENLNVNCKA